MPQRGWNIFIIVYVHKQTGPVLGPLSLHLKQPDREAAPSLWSGSQEMVLRVKLTDQQHEMGH